MPGELGLSRSAVNMVRWDLPWRAWLCAHETASQCQHFSVLAHVNHAHRLESEAQVSSSAKIDFVDFNVGIHTSTAALMLFGSLRQQLISCGIFASSKAERKSLSCRRRTWVPSRAICANALRQFASCCPVAPAVGLQLCSLRPWRS
jgi:hypothetical protein